MTHLLIVGQGRRARSALVFAPHLALYSTSRRLRGPPCLVLDRSQAGPGAAVCRYLGASDHFCGQDCARYYRRMAGWEILELTHYPVFAVIEKQGSFRLSHANTVHCVIITRARLVRDTKAIPRYLIYHVLPPYCVWRSPSQVSASRNYTSVTICEQDRWKVQCLCHIRWARWQGRFVECPNGWGPRTMEQLYLIESYAKYGYD